MFWILDVIFVGVEAHRVTKSDWLISLVAFAHVCCLHYQFACLIICFEGIVEAYVFQNVFNVFE